jgi:transposase
MKKEVSSDSIVRDILSRIHTKYSSEENNVLLNGIRGEESIASLCRHKVMPATIYTNAGAKVLTGRRKKTASGG